MKENKCFMNQYIFKRMIDGIEAEVAFQYTEDFWGEYSGIFVITFIRSKVEHISQGLRRNSLQS